MNIFRIGRGVSKRLHRYFSYKSIEFMYRSNIRKKCKKNKCRPLTRSQKSEIKNYYASFGLKNIDTNWHRYYTHLTGNFYKEYIPEDLFYNVIIPNINMKIMYPALMDKNILNKTFSNVLQPEIVLKNINGIFIDGIDGRFLNFEEAIEKCKQNSKMVIKPSIDSGGGKNVVIFELKGDQTDYENMSIRELVEQFQKNFIIQRYFIQHEQLSLLNPTSVNTLRIKSLIFNNKVEILDCIIRIGNINSKVDNASQGGIYCMINPNGLLEKKAYNSDGSAFLNCANGLVLEGFVIPFLNQVKEDVKHLHEQVPYFKLISWDISINEQGETVLIEYNTIGQGYSEEYGPLFGDFTNEILNGCNISV